MSCNNPSDINQTFIIEPIIFAGSGSTPIISACTAVFTNFIENCDNNASIFINDSTFIFSGNSFFNNGISAQTISGNTYYSGGTELITIINNAINQLTFTGNTSGSCINDLFISNLHGCSVITLHNDINPNVDNVIELGTPLRRFRNINTVSGVSTYWTADISISTPNLDLGLDSLSNSRIITANNSVIQNDTLNGGTY